MVLLAQAQNLVSFFVALELLSIPLYVMCGSAIRREASLESGLKYLIIGSLGLGDAALRVRAASTAPRARPTSPAIAAALGDGGEPTTP